MNSVLSAQDADASGEAETAFVYFYDPQDVQRSVADWPQSIRAAVCLSADGTCDFVLFHEDEEDDVLGRVARILGRAPGRFATNPPIDGYPERKLVFSEETALLRALYGDEGLLERAQDYAINYRFARDEGLDPGSTCDPHTHAEASRERLARRSVGKIFPLAKKRARRDPPQGYQRIDARKLVEFDADLNVVGGRLRLSRSGSDGVPLYSEDVFMRDDLAAFHLPAGILGRTGSEGLPLDMPLEAFPSEFCEVATTAVRVTILPSGVVVRRRTVRVGSDRPAIPSPTDTPEAGTGAVEGPSGRLILLRSLAQGLRVPALAAIGLIATGFFSAMVAQTFASDGEGWLWSRGAPTLDVFGAEKTQ